MACSSPRRHLDTMSESLRTTVVYSSVLLLDRLTGCRVQHTTAVVFPNTTCFAIYRRMLVFNNIRFANVLSDSHHQSSTGTTSPSASIHRDRCGIPILDVSPSFDRRHPSRCFTTPNARRTFSAKPPISTDHRIPRRRLVHAEAYLDRRAA